MTKPSFVEGFSLCNSSVRMPEKVSNPRKLATMPEARNRSISGGFGNMRQFRVTKGNWCTPDYESSALTMVSTEVLLRANRRATGRSYRAQRYLLEVGMRRDQAQVCW